MERKQNNLVSIGEAFGGLRKDSSIADGEGERSVLARGLRRAKP